MSSHQEDCDLLPDDIMSWILLNADTNLLDSSSETEGVFNKLPSNEGPNDGFDLATSFDFDPYVTHVDTSLTPRSAQAESDTTSTTGKKRKMPRNRESAKESRQRQRQKLEELEKRVAKLREENSELQSHLMTVTQRTTEVQKQRLEMEKLMTLHASQISNMNVNKELDALVQRFKDLYADYGTYRQKEVAFHLDQLEKLLLPSRTTKLCLWTLHQESASTGGSSNALDSATSPLFSMLAKELNVTPAQIATIQGHRRKIQMLLGQMKESLDLIKQLRVSIETKHATFDKEVGKIQKEATSQQIVQFLLWITRNANKLAEVIPDFERSVPHVPDVPYFTSP